MAIRRGSAPSVFSSKHPFIVRIAVIACLSGGLFSGADGAAQVDPIDAAFTLMDDTERPLSERLIGVQELLMADPDQAIVWSILGEMRLEADDDDGALMAFERAVAKDASLHTSWHHIGLLKKRGRRDLAGALVAFQQALDYGAPPARGLNELGVTHAQLGDYRRAIETWNRALAIDPDWGILYANCISAALRLDDFTLAEDFYRRLLDAKRFEEAGALFWGINLLERGENDAAVQAFALALNRSPSSPQLNYYHAEALLQAGEEEQALEAYKAAIDASLESDDRRILDAARQAAFRIEHPRDLKRLVKAQELISAMESKPAAAQSNLRAAIRELDAVLNGHHGLWEAQLMRGTAHRRLGNYELAKQDLNEVLMMAPNQPRALINLGLLNRDQGNNAEAIEYTRLALEHAGDDAEIILNAGFIMMDCGDCATAWELYRRARVLIPLEMIEDYDPLEPLEVELRTNCS